MIVACKVDVPHTHFRAKLSLHEVQLILVGIPYSSQTDMD